MNTTAIGDSFEARAFEIISDALRSGKLGIYTDQCKVFRKQGYYSKDRESDIIFDLAIEVWPPGAQNYALLYIIECKNYTKRVPVNDIEEFHDKIRQVSGVNVKGIFITNNTFQEGAFKYARSKGMMLIQVNFDSSYEIILHRVQRGVDKSKNKAASKLETWDDVLCNFFEHVFDAHSKVTGLEQLSAEAIEDRAQAFIKAMDETMYVDGTPLSVDKVTLCLERVYGIKTDFESSIGNDVNGNPILGYFDRQRRMIFVDRSVVYTNRFLFTLCHEVGHAVLHQNLKINQKSYNQFKDSEYNFAIGKHELKNSKNWIEWQANQFAACVILPKTALWAKVYAFHLKNGIRNPGTIYYDNQPVNKKDFYDLTTSLSNYFDVSYTSIRYRLQETGILRYADKQRGSHWTNYYFGAFGRAEDAYINEIDDYHQRDSRRRLRED